MVGKNDVCALLRVAIARCGAGRLGGLLEVPTSRNRFHLSRLPTLLLARSNKVDTIYQPNVWMGIYSANFFQTAKQERKKNNSQNASAMAMHRKYNYALIF